MKYIVLRNGRKIDVTFVDYFIRNKLLYIVEPTDNGTISTPIGVVVYEGEEE